MAKPLGFSAVANLELLSDEDLRSGVLATWDRLQRALQAGQDISVVRRLLFLELRRGADARLHICERLRAALSRALAREAEEALARHLQRVQVDESLNPEDLQTLGLTEDQAIIVMNEYNRRSLLNSIKQKG